MINKFFKKPSIEEIFWGWFSKNSDNYLYFEQNQNALFSKLKTELEKVNPNLTFEFGPMAKDNSREFVISADGIKSAFPAVQDLVEQAPSLKGWKIIAFRQPHTEITQISCNNLTIDMKDVYFKYEKNNGKIGLEIHIKDFYESPEWTNVIFILLDAILGEYDTEILLSYIHKKRLEESQKEALFNITELPAIVQLLKKELCN